jgi:hypothetical protein
MAGAHRRESPRGRRFHVLLSSLVLLVLLGALAGAAEAGPVLSIDPGTIEFVAPPDYVLTGAPPGVPQSGWVQIGNTGDAPLVMTDLAIAGPDAGIMAFDGNLYPDCGYGQDCAQTFTLPPGGLAWFPFTCTAAQAGSFSATLGITSNAVSGPSSVPMACVGLSPPIVQISPAGFDFGIAHRCTYGDGYCDMCPTKPLTQTVTITNAAAPPSRLDFYITPDLPATQYDDFIIPYLGSMCGQSTGGCSLPAGASLPIEITFRPQHDGVYSTPLSIVSSYPGQAPTQIPFYAEGGHGTLVFDTPGYLGAAPVGQPVTSTLTVHNGGRSCLSFQGPAISSPAIQLVGSYPPGLQLQSGQSYSWALSCTPPSTGFAGGFLDFDIFGEGVSLSSLDAYCEGLAAALVVEPAPLAFTGAAEVAVGTSATQRVTVRNAGNLATELAAITPSDPRFVAALVGGSLPAPLAPGATAQVDVTFTPAAGGRVAGTIAFDAAGDGDFSLDVVGDGVVLGAAAVPAAVDFGRITATAAPARHVELRNTGDRALTVVGVALDLPGDFAVTGLAGGATIPAGGALGFDVQPTPTMLGRRRARLTIDLDRLDPIADIVIPLDAIATDPALIVTTPDAAPDDYALDLGPVDVDVGPRLAKVALHNAAAAPVAIAACAIAGDPELTVASACPFAIPAGATAELAIAFAPAAEAESTAALTLTGTGFATGALRLSLRGTGIDQHVELSALAVAFPDTLRHPLDPPARTVTIRNTAAAELALSSIRVDGAGFTLIGPAAATLAPGASQDVAVGFAPAATGDAAGHLVLGNADDPQIARVALTGRGTSRAVEVGPPAIDLGAVPAGATVRLGDLAGGAIALRNLDPAATFAISSVAITGDPAYRLIGPDRTTLAPGDRAVLDVELAAGAAGRYDATISVFLDGDPAPHAQISITALAVDPPAGGCGCGATVPPHRLAPAAALVLALALVLRRRRRGRARRRRARAA